MAEDTLLDEIAEASKPVRQQCSVCLWLLEREDRPDFAKALAGKGIYTGAAIFKSMERRGFSGRVGAVERHRREDHK